MCQPIRMVITLTVWQRKRSGGHPTRAAEGRLESPTEESFAEMVEKLLGSIEPEQTPFQIVAQVGNSSRALQLEKGANSELVSGELWCQCARLAGVNG